MFVARVLYPVRVLGPGERIGLWLSGCGRACPGCSNPELWERKSDQEISVKRLSALLHRMAQRSAVDGLTITGGEPMDQAEELADLLEAAQDMTEDILIYTGYTLEELRARQDGATDAVLSRTAVLIDGPYLRSRNDGSPLRGSANQRVHVLKTAFAPAYRACMKQQNQIQNFSMGSSIVSVGIHRPDYGEALDAMAIRKGLVADE